MFEYGDKIYLCMYIVYNERSHLYRPNYAKDQMYK